MLTENAQHNCWAFSVFNYLRFLLEMEKWKPAKDLSSTMSILNCWAIKVRIEME